MNCIGRYVKFENTAMRLAKKGNNNAAKYKININI